MEELAFKPMKKVKPAGLWYEFINNYYWKGLFLALVLIALLTWNTGLLVLLAIIYVWLSWLSRVNAKEKAAMTYVLTDKSIRFTQDVSKVFRDTKYTPLETEWKIPFDDIREVELFVHDENARKRLLGLRDKYGARLPEHKQMHICSAGNDIPLPGKVVIIHTNREYPAVSSKPISYILTPENPETFYAELRARAKGAEFRERRYEG